jgi:hypothetical protein
VGCSVRIEAEVRVDSMAIPKFADGCLKMLLIVHISYQTPLGPTFDLGAESMESSRPRVRTYSALLPSYVYLPQYLGSSSPQTLTSDIDLNDNVLELAFDDTNTSSRTYFSRGSLTPSKTFPLFTAQSLVGSTNYFEPDM